MKIKALLVAVILLAVNTVFSQKLERIALSKHQWTGIALSKEGRMFVNFPSWSDHVPVKVAEIVNGEVLPFPNKKWNKKHFKAVQSVVIDAKNRLWIVDTGNPQFKGVQDRGPVLYCFNLKTNKQEKEITFERNLFTSESYFNDIRIDTQKEFAYLTDSGNGAIIVLNLKSGKARRLLDQHVSTESEVNYLICDGKKWNNNVHSDGIALSNDGKYLYYIALTGHTLYRIPTIALRDEHISEKNLEAQVEKVMAVPATDGMLFDKEGNLFLGGLEDRSINVLTKEGDLIQLIQDHKIRWADSFTEDRNGTIYFTCSQIHMDEADRGEYEIYKIKPSAWETAKKQKKILIAITNHAILGETNGQPTGYWLSEVSHAYYQFIDAGFEVDFVSPQGGKAPVTGVDLKDKENQRFLNDKEVQAAISNSIKASEIDASKYRAIYYAGGHGVMWDFEKNKELQNISRLIYEKGGVVSAVCHGSAGLLDIELSNGNYLVDGKTLTAFTNEEEVAIKLDKIVPFALETQLKKRGAVIEKSKPFQEKVVVDQRLITGQNPASAKGVAKAILDLLQ